MLLNVTMLVLWLAPKFVPLIVITALMGPALIERVVITGVGRTVKATALLKTLLTRIWTFTVPIGAFEGTTATIEPLFQLVMLAVSPPIMALLFPCVAPKP